LGSLEVVMLIVLGQEQTAHLVTWFTGMSTHLCTGREQAELVEVEVRNPTVASRYATC